MARLADGSEYLQEPYSKIDDFVSDIATLVRCFPKEMKRKADKTTVEGSLVNLTSASSLVYFQNFARFVARNPCVTVPYGTTPNEAYHMELKSMFRNIRSCTRSYAKTHAKIATAVKLIGGSMAEGGRTKRESQTTLLHAFCARLEKSHIRFVPRLGEKTVSRKEICKRPTANGMKRLASVVFKRPSAKYARPT